MGTTSEKLTYLNTTKNLIKEELNLGGANITNEPFRQYKSKLEGIYKDFLANGTDTLWNNWLPKVTGSGETITLNNTIEAKMDFVYKGNTSQTGTPTPDTPIPVQVVSGDNTIKVEGKNLFDINTTPIIAKVFYDNNGNKVSWGNTCGIEDYIKVIPDTIYSIANSLGVNVKICFYDNSKTYLSQTTVQTSTTNSFTTPNNANYIRFGIGNTESVEWVELDLGNTTPTTYTPYVSQTYPINLGNIELCKIGTYQDKIAKSTGKNLFDVSTITENTYIDENGNTGTSSVTNLSDYIEVKSNTSYTLSYDYSTLLNSNQRNVCYYNENKTFISSDVYIPTDKTHAITTPNNAKYIRFSYDKNCYSIMLNEGTTALPYEPYGKVWYLNKQIGKVVLDGSEDWQLEINATNYYEYKCFTGYNSSANISSHFDGTINSRITIAYNYLYLRFPKSAGIDVSTVELFKTWLSTNNTTVYYVKETPTYEEITDTTLISQLEAIKKSYNTQTSISQVNNDLPFELDVVALGE